MDGSTDRRIRDSIRRELERRGKAQVWLAEKMDMAPQHLSTFFSGGRGKIPTTLIRVLDALGLELTVRRKRKLKDS